MLTRVRNWIARRPLRNGLVLTVVILVVAGTVWTIRIAERAENLASELRATGSAAETALTAADPDTIPEISNSLNSSTETAQNLDDDLWPLRWAGTLVGWVPIVGDNVTAVPKIVERLNHDLVAAVSLLESAEILLSTYVELKDNDEGLTGTLHALPTESEVTDAVGLISEAKTALTEADNRAAEMRHGRLIGKLKRESQELQTHEARLRAIVEWAGLASESLVTLARMGEISTPLVGLFDAEDSSGIALGREALSAMPELEKAARDAYTTVASTNANTPAGITGSQIADVLVDFEPILLALAEVSKAGARTWAAISPALDKMESSEGGLIGEGTSILPALELLKEGRSEFQGARLTLDSLALELRTEKFKTKFGVSTARTLSSASMELALAAGFLSDFPDIGTQALGSNGPKRYLILGQTSDELRGSGGFVSGAWILTFDDGQMSDFEYHDIVEVDDQTRLDLYPLPPELLARHMDAPVWLLRDAMWSPEFPAAARTASEIFELGQGGPQVDGVIALTEWAIVGLVKALGSVMTDGGQINSEEVLPLLEAGTDAEGRAFVDKLFWSVLDQLRSPNVNDRLFGIARATSDMLSKKDVMVYMSEPALQEIVARSGWDGSLGRSEGDRITVIDSNIGWNKVDRNIERSFGYRVKLQTSGPMEARLTLSYHNNSGAGSRTCDIQAPIHGLSYSDLKEACYWNLVRVYVPEGELLLSNDPLPIPASSVFARSAAGLPGDDSVNIGIDSGGKFISGLLTVPPGETVTTGFNVMIPPDALISEEDMLTYRLSLHAQSGALGRDARVNLELPSGYEYVGSSHEPSSLVGTSIEFELQIESDTLVEVMMRRIPPAAGHQIDLNPSEIRSVSLR